MRKALRNHDIQNIVLASPGGSVFEGLQMAGIIFDKKLRTYIPRNAVCASACSYLFFAGNERLADGYLGVHQAYSADAQQKETVGQIQYVTQFTVSEIIGFLNEFGTPAFVFERMFQDLDMYFFDAIELMELNSLQFSIAQEDKVAIAQYASTQHGEKEFASRSDDQFAVCRDSTVAGNVGKVGGPFNLLDSNGKTVNDTDVITGPSLVYFGYTFCPDICPMDAVRNAEAVDVLEENGQMVTPVFISIDPKRDTPEVIGSYVELIHPRMVGLTGSAEQVKAASRAYQTYYKAHDGEHYLVDHSTLTYLVLPEHGVVEFFRRDASPKVVAETSACFIDKI